MEQKDQQAPNTGSPLLPPAAPHPGRNLSPDQPTEQPEGDKPEKEGNCCWNAFDVSSDCACCAYIGADYCCCSGYLPIIAVFLVLAGLLAGPPG